MNRIIGHVDMDAFFASLEERATPKFQGKPIVVGSDVKNGKGRGVVSTANYKAREYGIHSALPISRAWEMSQQAKSQGKEEVIFLVPNMPMYEKSSKNIFKILQKYSNSIEQGSIDEFYLDLSHNPISSIKNICKKIKKEIKEKENITCSIGIGSNKLISKIAAGINKPDGLLIIKPEKNEIFLNPLPIRKIPGIGLKTAQILNSRNIFTIGDLKNLSKQFLHSLLYKAGGDIYYKARGIDDAPILENQIQKSIGKQITFEKDIFDITNVTEKFLKHADDIFIKFEDSEFTDFKSISISVRFSDFKTVSSTKSSAELFEKKDKKRFRLEALKLLLPFLDKRRNKDLRPIRLIAIRLEKLSRKIA